MELGIRSELRLRKQIVIVIPTPSRSYVEITSSTSVRKRGQFELLA
jgi:hypothetical protein